MSAYDLTTPEGLRIACRDAEAEQRDLEWQNNLRDTLIWVRETSEAERRTVGFQQRLWENANIASAGRGDISVENAISDPEFRSWLAAVSCAELPTDRAKRIAALEQVHIGLLERIRKHCDRTPRLKIFRVLAALFPLDFTTIADLSILTEMLRRMFGSGKLDPIPGHVKIRDRLDEVLGPVEPNNMDSVAARLKLPWLLYALARSSETEATVKPGPRGEQELSPLPAIRRRRGLTAIGGLFPRLITELEFLREGATREEFMDHLRVANPSAKDASLSLVINVMKSEFGIVRHDGNRYFPNERGLALLESTDPDSLRDWLLTRVLGVDHVLMRVKGGPADRSDLVALLQSANPGWTATFGPGAQLSWLRSLDVIARDDGGRFRLTDRGAQWAELIHWTPEALALEEDADSEIVPALVARERLKPSFEEAYAAVAKRGVFRVEHVAALHMGLWADARRHFAVLSGLSGAGKTLLAHSYAEAIVGGADAGKKRLIILPVQPGWYDPTPLFGYVNPLSKDTYESTPFLHFVLRAVDDPAHPYVAVLDEMNLSHPEQYLAPLLSAMETGGAVELHCKGDGTHFDGVPRQIPYPENLVLIGTVNMDETTMGLSDKVLDRAFVLDFWEVDVDAWPGWKTTTLPGDEATNVRGVLGQLVDALSPARLHFGWRVVKDTVGYLEQRSRVADSLSPTAALDQVVYSKIVPKLRGDDSQRFSKALVDASKVLREQGLRRSAARLEELRADLETTGSARFWR